MALLADVNHHNMADVQFLWQCQFHSCAIVVAVKSLLAVFYVGGDRSLGLWYSGEEDSHTPSNDLLQQCIPSNGIEYIAHMSYIFYNCKCLLTCYVYSTNLYYNSFRVIICN